MKWLTLQRIKQQLRIEPDFTEEDEWLEDTGEVAEDAILEALNRSYSDLYDVYGHVPSPVRRASLLLVDSLYQFRGKDAIQTLQSTPTFAFLLKPYVKLTSNEQNANRYGCKNL